MCCFWCQHADFFDVHQVKTSSKRRKAAPFELRKKQLTDKSRESSGFMVFSSFLNLQFSPSLSHLTLLRILFLNGNQQGSSECKLFTTRLRSIQFICFWKTSLHAFACLWSALASHSQLSMSSLIWQSKRIGAQDIRDFAVSLSRWQEHEHTDWRLIESMSRDSISLKSEHSSWLKFNFNL